MAGGTTPVERPEAPARAPFHRILVALDASTSSLDALHTAVELAARFNARVQGLFVEDINLLRLAGLPFAREVSFLSSALYTLKSPEMESQLRAQAARIRSALARAANRAGVDWAFRTVRGAVGAEVLAAGADSDLVILGKIGRSLPGPRPSGSTVRTLVTRRRGMTLVMQTRFEWTGIPVAAVYDGTEAAGKTLATAAALARSTEAPLRIFIVGNTADADRLRGGAEQQLREQGIAAVFIRLVIPTPTQLAERIHRETAGPVVIPCTEDWFSGEKLCGLVDEIVNPVLLIR